MRCPDSCPPLTTAAPSLTGNREAQLDTPTMMPTHPSLWGDIPLRTSQVCKCRKSLFIILVHPLPLFFVKHKIPPFFFSISSIILLLSPLFFFFVRNGTIPSLFIFNGQQLSSSPVVSTGVCIKKTELHITPTQLYLWFALLWFFLVHISRTFVHLMVVLADAFLFALGMMPFLFLASPLGGGLTSPKHLRYPLLTVWSFLFADACYVGLAACHISSVPLPPLKTCHNRIAGNPCLGTSCWLCPSKQTVICGKSSVVSLLVFW